MEEEWKDIEGREGKYQVSNYGRIRSLNYNNTGEIKIIIPAKKKNGYLSVSFPQKGNKKRNYLVHRLVAIAFIPNPNNYPIINHKDEDKTNNNVSNLEWCTYYYNQHYGHCQERKSKKRINGSGSQKVGQYDLNGNLIRVYPSRREAQRNGFHSGAICACCAGKKKSHKGFIWRNIDE